MGIHETYSPVRDLIRDPRYGRAEESYGEDTFLCREFARAVVTGMQGEKLSDPDSIAAALLARLDNADLRRRHIADGLSRSTLYRWKNVADSALAVYREAIAKATA